MNCTTAVRSLRIVGTVDCALGAILMTRPRAVARLASGAGPCPALWIVQVLGARLAAQGTALLLRRDQRTARIGLGVDVVHALSMLAASSLLPRYRRPAMVSATMATLSAGTLLPASSDPR